MKKVKRTNETARDFSRPRNLTVTRSVYTLQRKFLVSSNSLLICYVKIIVIIIRDRFLLYLMILQ